MKVIWNFAVSSAMTMRCPSRIFDSIGCGPQMSSSVKANYWTMVSSILWDQCATSGVHTSVSTNAQRTHPLAQLFEKLVNKHSATHGDGNRLRQYEWPCNIRELRNVIEAAIISPEAASRPAADRHQGMMDVRP